MKLDVFDFDNTLVTTPANTLENQEKYEKATGIPWLIDKNMSRELTKKHGCFVPIRRGWYGRKETLEPPLVPDPCPHNFAIRDVVDQLIESKNREDTYTIIMTGRHAGLRNQVLRICGDLGILAVKRKNSKKDDQLFVENLDPKVVLYCLGDDGPGKNKKTPPKPNQTFPWKVWILEMFADYFPELEHIEIWEDREEHYKNFLLLNDSMLQTVTVNFVK